MRISILFCVNILTVTYAFISGSFDSRESTIEGIHNALYSGIASCHEVLSSFISRTEAFNPTINAIITLNPNALRIASIMDTLIVSGNATGALFCIPILLKDNYNTAEMNTTGGSLDLAGNKPAEDAPTVIAFKKAGAIILGKTNLHELALEGISVSSLGGQTINPYDHTRSPGGSSGGTGAAISSNFAVFGTGTYGIVTMVLKLCIVSNCKRQSNPNSNCHRCLETFSSLDEPLTCIVLEPIHGQLSINRVSHTI